MGFLGVLSIAVLAGITGLVVGGVVAARAVEWHRVSSFEGGAGYAAMGLALLAGVVSLALGGLVARAGAAAGFWRSLLAAELAVLGLIALAGGAARLLADVPPTLDGDDLYLEVELQWPTAGAPEPPALPAEGRIGLRSLPWLGHTVRASREGILWLADARQLEGRWVARGAVEIFTNRGRRALDFRSGEATLAGFLIPLGRPSRGDRQWSPWLPHSRDGSACWTGACKGQPLRYVSWVVNSCCGVEAYFDESGRLVGGVYQDDSVGPDGCAGRSVYGQEIACAREPIERCPR